MFFRYVTIVSVDDKLQPVRNLFDLNEKGIIKTGTAVKKGDILVSKQKSLLCVENEKDGTVVLVNQKVIENAIIIEIYIQK